MKKRTSIISIAVAVLALAGGGYAYWQRRPKPTEVELATVGREDIQAKVTANGKVQATKKVDISATIPGQITLLAVKEGDRVRKGQLLLQIDAVNPRAAARSNEFSMEALLQDQQSAAANLAQARADLRRSEDNYVAHIIPEAEVQRARTAVSTAAAAAEASARRVEQARATLEGAKDTLAKTTVRAPMDGIITAKRVEEGEVAVIGIQNSPGTVLLTISDMSIVETELEVDETSVPSVKVGQESRVRVDAYPNQTFKGLVTEVGGSPILPAAGLVGGGAKEVVVPIQALVIRDQEHKPGDAPDGTPRDEEGVFLNDAGKARFQAIKSGLLGELSLEVVSGLQGGESLITGPFKALRALKPGDLVKVEEKKKDGKP